MRRILSCLAVAALWASAATSASAATFGFGCVTNNNATNCADGVGQLSVEVLAGPGATQASFTFKNAGPDASSITDVYFDDGTLLGIASITNMTGVSFTQGASPGDLPGGNTIGFETSAGFLADSTPPAQPNGVNPGEQLTITFNLLPGTTFAQLIAAIEDGVGCNVDNSCAGTLRIGIHVQGFANGGSESFVNNPGGGGGSPDPQTVVPEPASLLLLGSGLGAVAAARRRRRGVTSAS